MGAGKTPEQWDAWTERMREAHGNGNGHGPSLAIEAQRLLPTPTVGDSRNSRNATAGRSVGATGHHAGVTLSDVAYQGSWGKYELAIRRWEERTRPAPAPTIEGSKGQAKLSPAFVEWMQGYPAGWCDGLTDNQQLKAYGNSVCPQQGMAAVALLEAAHTEAVAA